MSKKHFIAMADMIQLHRAEFSDQSIEILCQFCRAQNPRFKKDRWIDYINGDCGPSGGKPKIVSIYKEQK